MYLDAASTVVKVSAASVDSRIHFLVQFNEQFSDCRAGGQMMIEIKIHIVNV